VKGTVAGGPAARGGFREGDVIVAVNDIPTDDLSVSAVIVLLVDHEPGTKVKVTVQRGGETRILEITVGVYAP
jgi:S1-C subfamily serine protease